MKNGHKLIIAIVLLLIVIILAFQVSGYTNSANNTTNSSENGTSSQVSQKTTTTTKTISQNKTNPEVQSAVCPVCNGKGYYTCPICHGTGVDPLTGTKCEGGQAGCNGGIVHCYNCNGDGRMDPGDGYMT